MNLDVSYERQNLSACEIGYYGKPKEYVAKATALFVKKYGKECYTKTLHKAILAGNDYPKIFDETGSVDSALHLLEKYI